MSVATRGPGQSSLRRVPKQERSRERIDEILKVSMELIGRKGIDAVTMKEIAALSGGPIASVYQYFPNKTAIIAMLYDRYVEEVRSFVTDEIEKIATVEDALRATGTLFDLYYLKMRQEPSTLDLLNAVQADKALANLDIEETRFQSAVFYQATEQFVREPLRENYSRMLLVMFHMAGATLRLALLVPEDEAAEIMEKFRSIIRAEATYYFTGSFPASL